MRRRLIVPALAGLWFWPLAIGTAFARPDQPIRPTIPHTLAGGPDTIAPNGAPTEIVARRDIVKRDRDRRAEIIAKHGNKPE
jgi:hypothetical protein